MEVYPIGFVYLLAAAVFIASLCVILIESHVFFIERRTSPTTYERLFKIVPCVLGVILVFILVATFSSERAITNETTVNEIKITDMSVEGGISLHGSSYIYVVESVDDGDNKTIQRIRPSELKYDLDDDCELTLETVRYEKKVKIFGQDAFLLTDDEYVIHFMNR